MKILSDVVDIFSRRKMPIILQTESAECGLACVAMISGYYGSKIDIGTLRRKYSVSLKGMSLQDIINVSDSLGFYTRAVRLDIEDIDKLSLPAILHWNFNHFVVLEKKEFRKWKIYDPSRGVVYIDEKNFSSSFTGISLEITPSFDFKKKYYPEKLDVTKLFGNISGIKKTIFEGVTFTVIMQFWIVISPFLLQSVVDSVIPSNDIDLLIVLVIGFGIFSIINSTSTAIRQYMFLTVGNTLGFQISSNVANHLLKLPISYFERRHVGDIISRFSPVQQIQTSLTSGLLIGIIDGLLSIITLSIMIVYSWFLSIIALISLLFVIVIRLSVFQAMKSRNDSLIVAQARHDSYLIETVRGINALRLSGAEARRHSLWQNKMVDVANNRISYGKFDIAYRYGNDLILGIESITSIYICAKLALSGGFSIGMIYAYTSYKTQFITKMSSLIDRWLEFRMLDLYLTRLGDIALTPSDTAFNPKYTIERSTPLKGEIELKNIFYRYGDGEPWVLKNLCAKINAGEHVAIVGPSGCGKSTLMKLMLGVISPDSGGIFIDEEPILNFGLKPYRDQVAAVMQDDQLFAGSIADNISFFDVNASINHIHNCAKQASIHDDIMKMPMRYETHVGDMGTALSGGQKQRVLLARALYRRPKILFLDEGTAHLDPKTESIVNNYISTMGITRIVIAHRIETVKNAGRIIRLHKGSVLSDEKNIM